MFAPCKPLKPCVMYHWSISDSFTSYKEKNVINTTRKAVFTTPDYLHDLQICYIS